MSVQARGRAGWRRPADLLLRVVAALPLGYAVGSAWAMALARLLPLAPAEASVTGQLAAFVICAAAAMWAFAARSGWRAVWTLLLIGGVAGGLAAMSILGGGRL